MYGRNVTFDRWVGLVSVSGFRSVCLPNGRAEKTHLCRWGRKTEAKKDVATGGAVGYLNACGSRLVEPQRTLSVRLFISQYLVLPQFTMRFLTLFLSFLAVFNTAVTTNALLIDLDPVRLLGVDFSARTNYNAPRPPWVGGAVPGWYFGPHPERHPKLFCLVGVSTSFTGEKDGWSLDTDTASPSHFVFRPWSACSWQRTRAQTSAAFSYPIEKSIC
ncbi:hypothetical protein CC2G_002343 [Coprinopsis cinerea AmutBmut pab1-1]|nr:hypothetical protein CC2G_002343 [Coprinopsis cinerea AmutBmut pab1-1]